MRQINASEARKQFSELVSSARFGDERIVITKNGKEVVALVPYADFQLLNYLETQIDTEEAKKALEEIQTQGGTSLDDLKAELGME